MNQPIAGYLVLSTFISTANQQLRDAFAMFSQAGIQDLIVDLRYNGGGLVSTANLFASLLAGPGSTGLTFSSTEFNSANAMQNVSTSFSAEANAITLNRIVFITTGSSASASELVINGLEPYFTGAREVASVGSATFGKPVGQSGFEFCNSSKLLRAVTFRTTNVNGVGDYFNGLPVDCAAGDDLTRLLGDVNENMLATAISYIQNGSCPTSVVRNIAGTTQQAFKAASIEQGTTAQRLLKAY